MSLKDSNAVQDDSSDTKKRKRAANDEDIEVDLNAPEPPSKKALRKAKKSQSLQNAETKRLEESPSTKVIGDDDVVPNRGKRSEHGIWIGNLSFSTTKQDLLSFMTGDTEHPIHNEQITRINLPAGQAKHGKFQNKGFAYIDLADASVLQSALQLSEKLLSGRRVLIKNATSFEGRPKEAGKAVSSNPPSKRIFIGNLDFETTAEDLEKHFGACGPIQHTHMATFEDSGKCKGYAWIEFEQISSGQAAMRGWVESAGEADDANIKRSKQRIWLGKIKGRKLRLEYAEDKATRYNKRFGKNATKNDDEVAEPIVEEQSPSGGQADGHHVHHDIDGTEARKKFEGGHSRKKRYAVETVKRLTGAIVEGSGQKVVFD